MRTAEPFKASPSDSAAETTRKAQAEATRRYPGLGVKDSPENKSFVEAYQELKYAGGGSFFEDPEWPLRLAEMLAAREGWGSNHKPAKPAEDRPPAATDAPSARRPNPTRRAAGDAGDAGAAGGSSSGHGAGHRAAAKVGTAFSIYKVTYRWRTTPVFWPASPRRARAFRLAGALESRTWKRSCQEPNRRPGAPLGQTWDLPAPHAGVASGGPLTKAAAIRRKRTRQDASPSGLEARAPSDMAARWLRSQLSYLNIRDFVPW